MALDLWGDQAYRGQSEVIRECAPQARDWTQRRYRYKDGVDEVERAKNRSKSTVRSKVEHVFAVMKLKFGFVKLRFRGLQKNATQLFAVCALVNLYLARKKLLLLAPASPGAKVADHGRAAQAGGRPEKTVSQCREQGETGVLWCDSRAQKRNRSQGGNHAESLRVLIWESTLA